MSFFEELKRRNVFKVGTAYVVASWLIIQFSDILLDNMEAPSWVLNAIMLVLGIGFIVTLFAAWAFEMTPEGIKKESEVDRTQSITPQTGKKLNNTIVVMLILAVAYLLFDKFSSGPGSITEPISEQASTPPAVIEPGPVTSSTISRKSVAVLPFDNRSRNVDDEYFTEGIHDDLLTNLSRIGSLKVISRTSVNQYKGTEKTIPQIAGELGVATVMEGAVQRSGNTVRINVQLINAQTDEHMWAEIFDREMTTENLFAIQSEISEKIAEALEATLSPEEEQRINNFPTQSLEAYNAYLRGRQLLPQRNSKDLGEALKQFEIAVELDPEFALAWVGISDAANLMGDHSSINPDVKNTTMEAAINRALAINPQLGEAHTAHGALLTDLNKTAEAEAAYLRAIELSPNYATTYQWYSLLLSGTHDRLKEVLDLNSRAMELDPLAPIIRQNRILFLSNAGRYEEAETEFNQLMATNPDFSAGGSYVGYLVFSRQMGRIDEGTLQIQHSSRVDPGKMVSLVFEYLNWLSLGDYERAKSVYRQMEILDDESPELPRAKAYENVTLEQFEAAQEQAAYLSNRFKTPEEQWAAGVIFAYAGAYQRAREHFVRMDPRYLDRAKWAGILNEGDTDVCIVGLTLTQTGDEILGTELLGYAANYWEQTAPLYVLHADRFPAYECYAYLGEIEKSLSALEIALEHKHALHDWSLLKGVPGLRALRQHPRFVALDAQATAELNRQRENLARIEAEAGP